MDIPHTPLDAQTGVLVKSLLQQQLRKTEALIPGLDIRPVEAMLRPNGANKYFKFKHEFGHTQDRMGIFKAAILFLLLKKITRGNQCRLKGQQNVVKWPEILISSRDVV